MKVNSIVTSSREIHHNVIWTPLESELNSNKFPWPSVPSYNTCWDLKSTIPARRSRSRLGGRRHQETKLYVRVLVTGRTENGGGRWSTTVENHTGRRKRRIDGDQSFRSRAVLSSGTKTFSDRWNRYKGWHRSQNTIRARTRGGDTSLQKEKGVVSRMKNPIIARRKHITIITYTKLEGDIPCTLEYVIIEEMD